MNNIKNRISNLITDNLSSLVKFTGLLVSIGVLVILCSCGDDAVLYNSDGTEVAQEEELVSGDDDLSQAEGDVAVTSADEALEALREETLADVSVDEVRTTIIVHVCGAVNNPGVYEVDVTSRVIDAIDRAGGFSEDASIDALNLASGIADGSKIYVPTMEEVAEAEVAISEDNYQYVESTGVSQGAMVSASGTAEGAVSSGGLVNINTATKAELMTLTGIGATRADAIIAYREANGAFKSIEDIMNVSGIKSGSFDKIKDKITVR